MANKILKFTICIFTNGDLNVKVIRTAEGSEQHKSILQRYWKPNNSRNHCFKVKNNQIILAHYKITNS